MSFDALVMLGFGGPEHVDEVVPFLERVTAGRGIPAERLIEVGRHYLTLGGVSPINAQNRALIEALRPELKAHGIDLPVYFGNRNWHPLLPDTLREMVRDGRKKALAFVTSGQSSYSGCRQYRENIAVAQQTVGDAAPAVDKLRVFYNHPDYIAAELDRVREAIEKFAPADRERIHLHCTAHSIPHSMAGRCDYVQQLAEVEQSFGALVKQLPNRSEIDALLTDINQAGLGRGLVFELFKPAQQEQMKDFYAELPIAIKITGNYHDMGAFASDVAQLPRIVTLNDVAIVNDKGTLRLDAVAKTFRYLDEEEIQRQRRAAQAAKEKARKK